MFLKIISFFILKSKYKYGKREQIQNVWARKDAAKVPSDLLYEIQKEMP